MAVTAVGSDTVDGVLTATIVGGSADVAGPYYIKLTRDYSTGQWKCTTDVAGKLAGSCAQAAAASGS